MNFPYTILTEKEPITGIVSAKDENEARRKVAVIAWTHPGIIKITGSTLDETPWDEAEPLEEESGDDWYFP